MVGGPYRDRCSSSFLGGGIGWSISDADSAQCRGPLDDLVEHPFEKTNLLWAGIESAVIGEVEIITQGESNVTADRGDLELREHEPQLLTGSDSS